MSVNIYKVDPVTGRIYNPNLITQAAVGLGDIKLENIQEDQSEQAKENLNTSIEYLNQMQQRGKMVQEGIDKLKYGPDGQEIKAWPHAYPAVGSTMDRRDPKFGAKEGFMPSVLISPTVTTFQQPGVTKAPAQYEYEDWTGAKLVDIPDKINVEKRFKLSQDLPKKTADLPKDPYSMRDVPIMFGDTRFDYFRHGLQVVDNLGLPLTGDTGQSGASLATYKGTPYENSDPVMFGFDIIIDAISSPLLNGSILDFLNQYSTVNEIAARKNVYEDFKNQFVKFFRTKGTVKVEAENLYISRSTTNPANLDSSVNIYWPGKKAYMGYYLKKVSNLELLTESNKGDVYKYLPDYRKDLITLDFIEDVSLSLGTLAHLYKLLYWSKPNGKGIIPENLLRFNCDIVISECRNFVRTKKNIESGNLEVLKDNLSRHVFQLRECQFWFDKAVVPNEVDIGGQGPQVYDTHTISFDFKYATERFEKFIPNGNWGTYVGYNSGAIWKIGNPGERENRDSESGGTVKDSSIPKFLTVGQNSLKEEGIAAPFIIRVVGNAPIGADEVNVGELAPTETSVSDFKKASEQTGQQAAQAAEDQLKSSIPAETGANSTMKSTQESQSNFLKSLSNVPGASALKKSLTENAAGKLQTTLTVGVNNIIKSINEGNINAAKDAFGVGVGGLKQTLQNVAFNAGADTIGGGISDIKKSIQANQEQKERDKIAQGTADVKAAQLEKELNASKDAIPSDGVSQTREELLNQTIEKVSGATTTTEPIMGPPTYEDYLGQTMNFAGPSLGGSLFG